MFSHSRAWARRWSKAYTKQLWCRRPACSSLRRVGTGLPPHLRFKRLFVESVDPRSTPYVPPKSRGDLPHLYKSGGTYFVTFRLRDAVLARPKTEAFSRYPTVNPTLGANPSPEEIAGACDPPLTLGGCIPRKSHFAELVQNSLLYFDGKRYLLSAWCIMPNHVHAIFSPLSGHAPADILHSWKSFTSHEINRVQSTAGPVWERESFDHLVRSVESLERFVDYVEQNPVKAGLCARPEDWAFSSAAFELNYGAGVPEPQIAGETPAPQ